MADSTKPGGGGRFKALEGKLEHRQGVSDPARSPHTLGRRKYGAKRMGEMAAKGRERHAK